MEMKELLDGLAARVGIEGGFPPDEEGVVRVDVGNCTVAFREVPELYSLLVYGPLGSQSAQGSEALKDELLKANFMGRATAGGALSLSEDGIVYYHRLCDLRVLDLDGFMETLTDCVQTMLEWRQLIEAYAPVAEQRAEKEASDQAPLSGFNLQGLIRV